MVYSLNICSYTFCQVFYLFGFSTALSFWEGKGGCLANKDN